MTPKFPPNLELPEQHRSAPSAIDITNDISEVLAQQAEDPAMILPDPTTILPDPTAILPNPAIDITNDILEVLAQQPEEPATILPDPTTILPNPSAIDITNDISEVLGQQTEDPAMILPDPMTILPDPTTILPNPSAIDITNDKVLPQQPEEPATVLTDSTTILPDPTTILPDPKTIRPTKGGPDIRGPYPILKTLAAILPNNFIPPESGGVTIPVWGDFRSGGTVTASLRGLQPNFQDNHLLLESLLETLPSNYEILGMGFESMHAVSYAQGGSCGHGKAFVER